MLTKHEFSEYFRVRGKYGGDIHVLHECNVAHCAGADLAGKISGGQGP